MSDFIHSFDKYVDAAYATDYSIDKSSLKGEVPLTVIHPTCHSDCDDIIKKANETNIPIVIRGAGSGTTGGALPSKSSIVMSLDKMNKIIDFDTDNATITVEAGVVIKDLQDTVEKQGLFYPLDPASLNICTIGGNVAENAGGPRALKYGVTRDYVIGLKGVWANGASFELGGKQMKTLQGMI